MFVSWKWGAVVLVGLSAVAWTASALESPADDIMRDAIAKNKIQIFSKTFCPYCKSTKGVFEGLKVPFSVTELDQHEHGPKIQEALLKLTGQRTVPNVFIGGKHIGGNSDLMAVKESGKLMELLKEAKVTVEL